MTIRSSIFTGLNVGLKSSVLSKWGPATLADLDFRTPSTQALGSANATHQYLLQETSGNYADTGTGTAADITAFTAGLQGQSRPGIWNGSSVTAIKAWEADGATARAAVTDTSVFDSNNTDLYFRIEFAIASAPAAAAVLTEKRNAAAAGWTAEVQTDGTIDVIIEDESTNTITVSLVGNHCNGAPCYLELFYDDAADELTVNSNLDAGNAATDTSTVTGTLTNAKAWRLGDPDTGATAALFQVFLAEGAEGAAAATMFAETGWWTHGTHDDLTTASRNSLISYEVAAGQVAHWSGGTTPATCQLPSAYHSAFTHASKLGLLCNSAIVNQVFDSEDFTSAQWTKTTATITANSADAPDGFRSACLMESTAAGARVTDDMTNLLGSTQYTCSIWVKRATGSDVDGTLRLYDNNSAGYVATQAYTATDTWQRISVTGTLTAGAAGGQMDLWITTDTEDLYIWGAQCELGDKATSLVRTSGASAALVKSDYTALGAYVNESVGEIVATAVKLGTNLGVIWDSVDASDRRLAYIDASNQLVTAAYDSAGASEDSITSTATIAAGSLIVARMNWDTDGVDGGLYETVQVFGGTRKNGGAAPLEGSFGASTTGGFDIGQDRAAGNQFDGIIARILSYDGENTF
jgi:hypothetical protein